MRREKEEHRRRSLRLRDFDYRSPGPYFVTLCARDRAMLFGTIIDDEMRLNRLGRIVQGEWFRSAEIRAELVLDAFIVIPNHVHGIVMIDSEVSSVTGRIASAPTALASIARSVCRWV